MLHDINLDISESSEWLIILCHVKNDEIRKEREADVSVIVNIRKGTLRWFGYVWRMKEEKCESKENIHL